MDIFQFLLYINKLLTILRDVIFEICINLNGNFYILIYCTLLNRMLLTISREVIFEIDIFLMEFFKFVLSIIS